MPIAPGSVVGGKYVIERALARGGMGSVWVARHIQLGAPVAVKFLDASFAASAAHRARFEREARAAATLRSPHVVHVQDYGFEGDAPYLVMELLEGEDLGQRLHRVRRMSPHDALRVLRQVAKALRKAHEAGIAHRDLKPANLFVARVDDEEVVKVLDFGIAKETHARIGEATRTGEVMGSPHYMSPEQVRAEKDVDHRTDLWSLGVIVYRMLVGELPFPGDQLGPVLAKILTDPYVPPSQAAPGLSPAFDAFFGRALARDKAMRFQSVGEFVEGFQLAVGREAMGSLSEVSMPGPAMPYAPAPFSGGAASGPASPAVNPGAGGSPTMWTPPNAVTGPTNAATVPLGAVPPQGAAQSGGVAAMLAPSSPITGSGPQPAQAAPPLSGSGPHSNPLSGSGPQRISGPYGAPASTTTGISSTGSSHKPRSSGLVAAIAIVALLGLGAAAVAFFLLRGPSSTSDAASPPPSGTPVPTGEAPSPSTDVTAPVVTPSVTPSTLPSVEPAAPSTQAASPAGSSSAGPGNTGSTPPKVQGTAAQKQKAPGTATTTREKWF